MVVVAGLGIVVLAALGGALAFSRTLKPKNRVVFWVGVVLVLLVVVPQLYRGAQAGYRVGREIRAGQDR